VGRSAAGELPLTYKINNTPSCGLINPFSEQGVPAVVAEPGRLRSLGRCAGMVSRKVV
jgi:hypothetical protein